LPSKDDLESGRIDGEEASLRRSMPCTRGMMLLNCCRVVDC
jgi:hypothetical protein